jgi:hypothetical protein
MGLFCSIHYFLRVTAQVTYDEVELGNANFESHVRMLMKTVAQCAPSGAFPAYVGRLHGA